MVPLTPKAQKRPATQSTTSDTENIQNETNKNAQINTNANTNRKDDTQKQVTQTNKKLRTNNLENIQLEEALKPIKDEVEKNTYILSYEDLKEFLENTYGNPDPLSIARDYTTNIYALIEMLNKLYPKLTERSLKTKFSKITNKLKLQLRKGLNLTPSSSQESLKASMESLIEKQQ